MKIAKDGVIEKIAKNAVTEKMVCQGEDIRHGVSDIFRA